MFNLDGDAVESTLKLLVALVALMVSRSLHQSNVAGMWSNNYGKWSRERGLLGEEDARGRLCACRNLLDGETSWGVCYECSLIHLPLGLIFEMIDIILRFNDHGDRISYTDLPLCWSI